jgi:hypothetical protein
MVMLLVEYSICIEKYISKQNKKNVENSPYVYAQGNFLLRQAIDWIGCHFWRDAMQNHFLIPHHSFLGLDVAKKFNF